VDAYIGDAVLQITKSHTGNFTAGANGTYTLNVTNQGPSTAGAPIIVSDTMVSPESFVSASGSNSTSEWECTFSSPTVTCTLEHALGQWCHHPREWRDRSPPQCGGGHTVEHRERHPGHQHGGGELADLGPPCPKHCE